MVRTTTSFSDRCGYAGTKSILAFVFGRGKATHVELLGRESSPGWAANATPAKAHARRERYAAKSSTDFVRIALCRRWAMDLLITRDTNRASGLEFRFHWPTRSREQPLAFPGDLHVDARCRFRSDLSATATCPASVGPPIELARVADSKAPRAQ